MRLVCGFIESADFLFAPVFRGLPAMIVERATEDRVGAMIASTVGEIVAGVDAAAPGSQLLLGRLMELLFVELLRRQVARAPAGATGWFAALNDPVVAQALADAHAAGRALDGGRDRAPLGSSRSVLGERFKALLGRPPIDYLAAWRIQLAAERLRGGSENVPRVAASVGYDSEAAFSRAFKRLTGVAPGRWRETGGTERPPKAARIERAPRIASTGPGKRLASCDTRITASCCARDAVYALGPRSQCVHSSAGRTSMQAARPSPVT